MMSLPLGPLALPVAPLLLLAAAWLASWLADRLASRAAPSPDAAPGTDGTPGPPGTDGAHGARGTPGRATTRALVIGLIAARLAFVVLNAQAYRADPWSAIDLRDGGWHAPTGVAAGLAWIAWQAWRRAPWRRPLAAGAAIGLAIWLGGSLALQRLAPAGVPDLTLTALADGAPVRLREAAQGRVLVLNLWATWCGPCRREMPVLADAQRRHPDVLFVFANQGEDAATVRGYLAAERLALSNVMLDPRWTLGPAVGSSGLPTTVIYDATGRRVHAHMGQISAAALAAALSSAAQR